MSVEVAVGDRLIIRTIDTLTTAVIILSGILLIHSVDKDTYSVSILNAVVPALFIIVCLLSSKWRKSYRVGFYMIVFTAGFVVYMGEIVLGYADLYRHHNLFKRRMNKQLELIDNASARVEVVYPIFGSCGLLAQGCDSILTARSFKSWENRYGRRSKPSVGRAVRENKV